MAFNRNRNGGDRGGFRSRPSFGKPRFGDRGDRGSVEMHQAICDNCGKSCEVPFRPTSGKPVFCSSCFENNRGSDSGRNFSRPTNFEERQMFDATCDECGNKCSVPFQPSSGKPVYCSNCFGEKKGAGNSENVQSQPQYKTSLMSNNKEQFEALNNKLDQILLMLTPNISVPAVQIEEQTVDPELETKVVKKKPSKKK